MDTDYEVVSKLGEGGMGVVFEARQSHLNRLVALKMIRPMHAGDRLARACFFYEAVITAGLEHPGIVPVLEFGRDQDGRDFYVMMKATGVPWSRVIRDKTQEENLAIFERVADVVAHAHARGILHRDLKPANVLLGDFGEVWTGDWGVAVARGADGTYCHAHPGGTPLYMPPEMARGDARQLGPWSDVYMLGVILLEIVTGKPPNPGTDALGALFNAANNICTEIGDADGLREVFAKALSGSPMERYPSVPDLQAAVRDALAMKVCRKHIAKAEWLQSKARQSGEYDMFQQALSEYDAALAAYPEHHAATGKRRNTVAAYARRALGNGEYDLALSIIEPEVLSWDKAALLASAIKAAKKDEQYKRSRNKKIQWAVFGTSLILAVTALGLYLDSRSRLGQVQQHFDENDLAMHEVSQGVKAFEEIRQNTLRHGARSEIALNLPGGLYFNHILMNSDFLSLERPFPGSDEDQGVYEQELQEYNARLELQRRWDAERAQIIDRLTVLLEPVRQACDAKIDTDDDITAIYQKLKSLRPELQKEVENIDALVVSQSLEPEAAKRMRECLLRLLDTPDEFSSSY